MKLQALADFIETHHKPVKMAIAVAQDKYLIDAVIKAYDSQLVIPLMIGNREEILSLLPSSGKYHETFQIIDEKDELLACKKAIDFLKNDEADIICKGLVSTKVLMKEILSKSNNLLESPLVSHLAVFDSPYYHKLLGITDAALNIAPATEEKKTIAINAIKVFHKLKVEKPKVAFLSATEKIHPKIASSLEADELKKWFDANRNDCITDGPLALDNAISGSAAKHKNISGKVAGDADILVVPNIESGNILYKSLNFLGGAVSASTILGTKKPVVLTSRSDSAETKFYSIVLAAAIL